MPRKVSKTDKPALLFLEPPVCGARLHNVPEVRAALNPKDFFCETQTHSSSTLNSWVNPQFDSSAAAGPLGRQGRRKCLSATSILGSCSQLYRKNGVCKYPSLPFQTGSREQSHKPKSTRTKKAAECTVVSNVRNQPRESRQSKRTVSSAQSSAPSAPKNQLSTIRKKNVETFSDGAVSGARCLEQPETPPAEVIESCRIPADGPSTPASDYFSNTEVGNVGPPPDVDTPKIRQEGGSCPYWLLAQPPTPPCNPLPDILVADTPERDYGVKVTWRRRRGLMLMFKERGHLSESDVLINC
ncbi:RAD9, HUS1, RAD1-interacting nuclear orphan protein 1 [Odontesthes bonariensis]|uniref:RAD9, HUS1, RAD1-interacting nuclear orphan protein 1 n=1 Tax=Odontesthes bonariensis TaxID=219752 RepID=UPI003F58755E